MEGKLTKLYDTFLYYFKWYRNLVQYVESLWFDVEAAEDTLVECTKNLTENSERILALEKKVEELTEKLSEKKDEDSAPKNFTKASDIMDRYYQAYQEKNS